MGSEPTVNMPVEPVTPTEPTAATVTTETAVAAPAIEPTDTPAPVTPAVTAVEPPAALAAVAARIDAIDAKIAAGGTLTPAEKREKTRLEEFSSLASAKDYDPFDPKSTSALTGALAEMAETNRRLEERLNRQEQATQQAVATATWAQQERKYPGVNVVEIWDRALADAEKVLGNDAEAVAKLANHYYTERAANAAKSVAAKPPTPGRPVLPGGASVQTRVPGVVAPPASVPKTADERYIDDAVKYLIPAYDTGPTGR